MSSFQPYLFVTSLACYLESRCGTTEFPAFCPSEACLKAPHPLP